MGLSMFSACSCDCPAPELPKPNPRNYRIHEIEILGDYMILLVRYPDCTNYEGVKVLVYKGVSLQQIVDQEKLDPHFCEGGGHPSPVARFEPTKRGMEMAVRFARGEGE